MNDIILLKQGEMVLKGLNKRIFEQKLMANVNRRLAQFGEWNVYCIQSTVYVEPKGECDMDGAFDAMKTVFGVAAVSRAAAAPKDAAAIVETAKTYLADTLRAARSFKVESKRADKSFPMTSIQLSQYVGGELHDAFPHLTVDVHEPELVVNVEIRDLAAYVHAGGEPGAGGLPVGTCGRAVTLLSGGIDSPVSTWMIARRGVEVIPVHFFSPPYTSEAAKRKVLELARLLLPWCGKLMVEIVPFTEIQEQIRLKCPEEYFTLIMRRFMMRLAENVADLNGCKALVTGENLGQVASQTMEALAVTEDACSLPILRPLIGMDKTEIISRAREIGTFETSILPYEDCCTVFTPRHPKTKPRLEDVVAAESVLDIEALVAEAAANTERVRIQP
ncbi:MAG: tRNA 4-thiouridine(8) synthase ThiI [Oscillospiraceae bacterium]|nr:tRNA 4-thiouridine(8) synthase ThiI [Oscillospiraceae bacterium]